MKHTAVFKTTFDVEDMVLMLENKRSSRLEQQNSDLSEIEVDEVLCLVRHVRSKVAANDAVPCRRVLLHQVSGAKMKREEE